MSVSNRLARWIHRYGAAELAGSCAAIGGSWLAHALGATEIVTAGMAAGGECVFYYATIALRDVARRRRENPAQAGQDDRRSLCPALRELAMEFGPAELLDSALIRPLAIALGIRSLGLGLGVIAGKLVADAAFYVPVIVMYEWRRRAPRTATRRVRHSFGG